MIWDILVISKLYLSYIYVTSKLHLYHHDNVMKKNKHSWFRIHIAHPVAILINSRIYIHGFLDC